MTLISSAAAIAVIGNAVAYLFYPTAILLVTALALVLVLLVATLSTRVEAMPVPAVPTDSDLEHIGKIRL